MATAAKAKESLERIYRFVLKDKWGFSSIPPAQDFVGFGKALLVCANGDGKLAPAEREWVLGYLATGGASDAVLAELNTYAAKDDIVKLVAATPSVAASSRAVIFHAIAACAADGDLSSGERKTVVRMAGALGVSEDGVKQIERAYVAERRAVADKIKVVFPNGSPF